MKMFFLFLLAAVLGVTFIPCEGKRISRQIWPAPNNPNFFWDVDGPEDDRNMFDYGDFWVGPPRTPKNQDNFRRNPGRGRNDRNQNRRTTSTTTTADGLGPITSTPTTIHYAPKGCKCPLTQQFNPVCGTDGNTYKNAGLLNCYQRCGSNVSQRRLGSC